MLADPMDDTTWDNSNSIYHSKLTSRYSHIPEHKWEKIFGYKWMSYVWQKDRKRWIMLPTPLRTKV